MRVLLLLLAAVLATGCTGLDGSAASLLSEEGLEVVDETGMPIPYVSYTLLLDGVAVARGTAGRDGTFLLPSVNADEIVLAATGRETLLLAAVDAHSGPLVMRAGESTQMADATPGLRMLSPYLYDAYTFGPEAVCAYRNTCGLSEPVVENAPGDVVYVSSVCCVGGSPPVWVSRDAGASWATLDTPGIREAVGIEGDFAVDAAGNVYFTDILVGAMWITSWDAEGNWRHTTPVPLPPLVDRPWVRAGAEDVVYFLYNTGASTGFHVSTDGGRTFSPIATHTFPAGLGTIAQGPEAEHLWVVAGMLLYESTDGGATWSEGEDVPLPPVGSDGTNYGFPVPAVDAAGNVGVAYDLGNAEDGYAIHLAVRTPSGAWSVHGVSPSEPLARGTHVMPWVEAGPEGGFVVAWYGIDAETNAPDAVDPAAPWYAFVAATHDAGVTWQLALADAEPVLEGPMARRLLDFLQVDLDEAGAAHVVYAHNREGGNGERTSYVRTSVGLVLPQLPPVATDGSRLLPRALEPLVS